MIKEKVCIRLDHISAVVLEEKDFSSFACLGYAFVCGDDEKHDFTLIFKRVYEGGYDLIAAIDSAINKFYIQDFDDDKELLLGLVDSYRSKSSIDFGNFKDLVLITPCGSMGTVIDVKIVESASGEPQFFFDDVQYISNKEWCFVCDSNGIPLTVINFSGSYVVLMNAHEGSEEPFEKRRIAPTADIKKRVKLI